LATIKSAQFEVVILSAKRLEIVRGQLRIGGTLDKFKKLERKNGEQYA
jgi:hypothetical protein